MSSELKECNYKLAVDILTEALCAYSAGFHLELDSDRTPTGKLTRKAEVRQAKHGATMRLSRRVAWAIGLVEADELDGDVWFDLVRHLYLTEVLDGRRTYRRSASGYVDSITDGGFTALLDREQAELEAAVSNMRVRVPAPVAAALAEEAGR